MNCPKCVFDTNVKSGFLKGKQRYKCKQCGCNFTQSQKRGASLETKLFALKLYLEGTGFRAIGRILNVSNVTVLLWIRTLRKRVISTVQAQMPDDIRHVDVIEMDEMWLYQEKKRTRWVWVAIDRVSQDGLGFSIGSRGRKAYGALISQIKKVSVDHTASDNWKIYHDLP